MPKVNNVMVTSTGMELHTSLTLAINISKFYVWSLVEVLIN